MKKRIIKIGNSQGITFTTQEMDNYGMVLGDVIDLDDMFLTQVKSKRNKYKKLPTGSDNVELLKKIKKEIKK